MIYNFPYTGLVQDSSLGSVGSGGYYWSRTAGSDTGAYYLFFYSIYVYPAYDNIRYSGLSIRCVATT